MRRVVIWIIGCFALTATLTGCGTTRSHGSIVVYNGQHTQLTNALVAAFERQTGITVLLRTNDSLVLANQILEEGRSSPADVYISENSPELQTLSQHGLLAHLSPSILDQVPANDRTSTWVGMALRVSALVYNPSLISRAQLPASVLQLANPRWRNKIAIAPLDSDFPPLVGAVIHRYGTQETTAWLAGLRRNARAYQDDEGVVAAVNRGDIACGIINQYYWYRLRLELKPSALHSTLYYFPNHNVGSVTNISGAAILTAAHNPTDAQRFIAFLISKTGQQLIAASDDFEYPIRHDVNPNPALPSLASINHATLSPAALGTNENALKLLQTSGLV